MTPKQESFVREYLLDSNATQAATRAGYSARTANEQGARLLANASVAAAISEARRKIAERADFTVDEHMDTLARLRDQAEKEGKYSAAVSAEMARGKVAGFYVDRVEMNAKVLGTVSYQANMPKRVKT
jgi:phage terminase small subunit